MPKKVLKTYFESPMGLGERLEVAGYPIIYFRDDDDNSRRFAVATIPKDETFPDEVLNEIDGDFVDWWAVGETPEFIKENFKGPDFVYWWVFD